MPIDYTKNWKRMRKISPKRFDKRSFRTKLINKNTEIITGCLKGHWHPSRKKGKQCDIGLKLQSFRKRRNK